jgi:hypothetical protein
VSFDLVVWYPDRRLSRDEAEARYHRLREGRDDELVAHPSVAAFYEELTAKHPEIDNVPAENVEDVEFCPWSGAMDRSPGHVLMRSRFSRAGYVRTLVGALAQKHGLAVYDPQVEAIVYPSRDGPRLN